MWASLDIAYIQTADEAHVSEWLEIQIAPSWGTWLEPFTCPLWTAHVHPFFGNQKKAEASACQGLSLIQGVDALTVVLREALVCNSCVGAAETGRKIVRNQYRTRLQMNLFRRVWEHDEKFGVVCTSKWNLIIFEWVISLRNEPLFMQIGFKWEYLTKGFDPRIMKALINVHLGSTQSLTAYSGTYCKDFCFTLWQSLDYMFLIRMKNR